MAKQPGLDFQSAKGGLGELERRLLFVVGALIVFRIGFLLFRSPVLMPLYLPNCLSNSEAPSLKCSTCSLVVLSARNFYLCARDYAVHFGIDHPCSC
ncbi:hypothetical protein MJK72_26270 [Klebsiella pneumoniae]|nr:hypothetical protein MJK72_26270 [Klebsiella pneumoniae]